MTTEKSADGKTTTAEAGRCGPGVRSDCRVKITLTDSGGIDLQLNTKVESMYG